MRGFELLLICKTFWVALRMFTSLWYLCKVANIEDIEEYRDWLVETPTIKNPLIRNHILEYLDARIEDKIRRHKEPF